MTTSSSFFRIKTESAPKTGLNAKGCINYVVLRDANNSDAYLCLLGNDGGGHHSQEAVPFSAIKTCLEGVNNEHPIPAKTFKTAFQGRSANNAGFLVAVLRHEGLLQPAPDASHQHVLGGNWDSWLQAMLTEVGEPFELPEVTKAKAKEAATISSTNDVLEHTKTKKLRKAPGGKRELPSLTTDGGEYASPA